MNVNDLSILRWIGVVQRLILG